MIKFTRPNLPNRQDWRRNGIQTNHISQGSLSSTKPLIYEFSSLSTQSHELVWTQAPYVSSTVPAGHAQRPSLQMMSVSTHPPGCPISWQVFGQIGRSEQSNHSFPLVQLSASGGNSVDAMVCSEGISWREYELNCIRDEVWIQR